MGAKTIHDEHTMLANHYEVDLSTLLLLAYTRALKERKIKVATDIHKAYHMPRKQFKLKKSK